VKTWKSKWYEDKNYAKWLHEDLKLKSAIRKKFAHAGIADIEIERAANKAKVVIYTSRPGIIIGKRGAGVEQLKADLQKLTENELFVDIQEIRNHIAQVKRAAVGDSAEAELTREDAEAVEREMARGNKLYPLDMAFYVRGEDLKDLRANVNQLNALLLPNGLQPILQEADLLALDSYLRHLPMAYDVSLDKRRRRSRLVFSSHTANLLPLYGRSKGTGHPGLVFFNRGAEPLTFDPLHRADRKKNAHMLILGPTGAGKSALLVYLLQQMAAMYRPRIFIIEAGGSFSLLGQQFRAHGLTVNQVTLNPNTEVSLPPFADALRVLQKERPVPLREDPEVLAEEDEESDEEGSGRDILGEMEIAARIMITGGDEREDQALVVAHVAQAPRGAALFEIAEGAGAITLAAALTDPHPARGPAAVVLTGGNVDADVYLRALAVPGTAP